MSRIVFKCEFGLETGWGHVIRSSAVAGQFQENGWDTVLWSNSDVSALPSEVSSSFGSCREDPFLRPIAAGFDVVFVDEMYTSDDDLEEKLALNKSVRRNQVHVGVDDMQLRSMGSFDIVINTELGLKSATYRCGKQLLGEAYAMLRRGLQENEEIADWAIPENTRAVLLMLGATDAFSHLEKALDCLKEKCGFAPVVVLGKGHPRRASIAEVLKEFEYHQLLEGLDSFALAAWMRRCDFGVLGCGSSIFEAAACELPFIGISLVDNQRASAAKVRDIWGMPVVFRENASDKPLDLKEELKAAEKIERGPYSLVDGLGCSRIYDTITEALETL